MEISTRTRWLVTALAVAAVAAPTAQAGSRPTPADVEAQGWAAVLGVSGTPTVSPAEVEAKNWQSVLGVETTVDPLTAARYEAEGFQRIYGVPSIGTVTPPEALTREGVFWQRARSPEATPAQIVSRDGFDYSDAGIGAAVAMGAALLVAAGTLATRRHRRPAHS